MTAAAVIPDGAETIERIVRRAAALYTLPAVAVEVLRLTDHPKVDVAALRECIERDPALTAKLLRVVNSSLFGLSRKVGDLNQALAMLGTKPLKLLVLGFSLPEKLFLDVARDQLQWYWNTTLVRAVAAREISERYFDRPGDDAFLAGLLEDIGVLVLLRELGGPYASLVRQAIAAGEDLHEAERTAMGFDHAQLSARLLEDWNMPTTLVRVVGEPRDCKLWAHHRAEHAWLVRVLHLAELFAQLVGQHRLSVLPDLLETSEAYCGLDRPQVSELVADLEPKVRQLAKVLSLDAASSERYAEIVREAHERMARLAEETAAPLSAVAGLDDDAREDVAETAALTLAGDLQRAVDRFLLRPSEGGTRSATEDLRVAANPKRALGVELAATRRHSEAERAGRDAGPLEFVGPARDEFDVRLKLAAGHCRAMRESLSVMMLGVALKGGASAALDARLEKLLDSACDAAGMERGFVERSAPLRRILVLAGCDRRDAVAAGRQCVEQLQEALATLAASGPLPPCKAAAGVAAVGVPAKNFQATALLDTAQRCLAAALTSGGVKSLEVS
jgi:HD-like signal output (HDOD) protein